ncbi:MAG: hypothetical protein PHV25_00255 [Candidatus Pacebacteria bacterium]|nr:hypothetical protein [Candidatus Paceibacterota bacterium]
MVVGHSQQRQVLSNMIKSGKVPHAMLFEGLSGLGKKTVALDFASQLLSSPNLNHPDLLIVEPEDGEIKIGQIRSLIERFSMKPYSAQYKVVIINDAHLMNDFAQNSILKILEEPTGDSVLILVTDHSDSLLNTVRSRMSKIKFFPVSFSEVKKHLTYLDCQDKVAEEIALFSFGRPGLAIDFKNDYSKISLRREKIKELMVLISPKTPVFKKFQYIKEIEEPQDLLEIWLSYFRALMIKSVNGEKTSYSISKISEVLVALENAICLIARTNTNKKIVLETLIIKM